MRVVLEVVRDSYGKLHDVLQIPINKDLDIVATGDPLHPWGQTVKGILKVMFKPNQIIVLEVEE